MTCQTCRFERNGLCHRFPPQLMGSAGHYPPAIEWCGEHKPKVSDNQEAVELPKLPSNKRAGHTTFKVTPHGLQKESSDANR